jgi:hypothetical protein
MVAACLQPVLSQSTWGGGREPVKHNADSVPATGRAATSGVTEERQSGVSGVTEEWPRTGGSLVVLLGNGGSG